MKFTSFACGGAEAEFSGPQAICFDISKLKTEWLGHGTSPLTLNWENVQLSLTRTYPYIEAHLLKLKFRSWIASGCTFQSGCRA